MSQFLSIWVSACGLSTEGNSGFLAAGWLASHSCVPQRERPRRKLCPFIVYPLSCSNTRTVLAYNRCPRNSFEMRKKIQIYFIKVIEELPWRTVFLPGEFHGQSSKSPRGPKEADTTEPLTHTDTEEWIV